MASSLSKKAVIIAVGTGIQSLLTQIGVNLFLVRIFETQELFGMYRQVWLIINTAQSVFLFGIHFSLYYYFPNLAEALRKAFVVRCIGALVVSGIVLGTALYLCAGVLATLFGTQDLTVLFEAAGFYLLLSMPALLLFFFLIAADRPLRATIYNTGILLSQAVLIVVLVASGIDLDSVFKILVAFAAARLVFALFEMNRLSTGPLRASLEIPLGSHLKYAFLVGMTDTVVVLGSRLDKFVISSHMDSAAYGLYSVGALEFPVILLISTAVATVMRPRISKLHHDGDPDRILELCRSVFRKLALILIPLAAYLALFAGELLELLYTKAYVDAAVFFRIFLGLAMFRIVLFEPILASVGKARTVFLGGVGFLVVDLILNVVLIRVLGMVGPPLATVFATGCLSVYYGSRVKAYFRIGWGQLLPVSVFVRVGVFSAAAGLAAVPLRNLGWSPVLVLLVGAGVFAIVYLGAAMVTRTITRNDLAMVKGWLKRPVVTDQ